MPANRTKRIPNVTIENARITFRNFAGKAGRFNAAGDRNFAILLDDPQIVQALEADGWNVKFLNPREEGDAPQPYLPVKIKFSENAPPPRIVLVTSRGRNPLTEAELEILDWAVFKNVDVIVRPYQWSLDTGKSGITAYVKTAFITIEEDALEMKYADVPDAPDSSQALVGVIADDLNFG